MLMKYFKYKFFNLSQASIESYKIDFIKFEDIEQIRKWRNSSIKYLRQEHKITKKEQTLYFKKNVHEQTKLKKPKHILFGFKKDDILIGYGGLVHISWVNKNAELSFLLNPKFNGKTYKIFFNKYINLLVNLSFNHYKLKKIYTQTYSYRKINIELLKKNKFIKEGCLKNHIFKNGQFSDLVIQSLENKKYE